MDMGMMEKRLSPGVENGQKTETSSQMARRRCDLQQRLAHGSEHQTIDQLRILQCERGQHIRQREHHVGVRHRQQELLLRLEPLRRGTALALRAVIVAARVVRNPLVSAFLADLDMPAEFSRAAGDERLEDLRLGQGERGQPPPRNESAQQVGYLECRPRHSDHQAVNRQAIEGTGSLAQGSHSGGLREGEKPLARYRYHALRPKGRALGYPTPTAKRFRSTTFNVPAARICCCASSRR